MSEKLTIDTPEQIGLEFTLAGIGSRFLAIAVDMSIQAAGMLVIVGIAVGFALLDAKMRGGPFSPWPVAIAVLLIFVLSYGYFALFEAIWKGQTPGKRLVRIRVIGDTGRPLSTQQAIIRNLVRIVDALPGIYAVGIVSTFVSARQQRLGDLAAGTVVVHERPITSERALYVQTGPALDVHLTDAETVLIEAFLRRRADLDWNVREQTAAEIAGRIRRRLSMPSGGSDEELLEQAAAASRASKTFGR